MNTEKLRLKASEAVGDYLSESVHKVVFGKKNLEAARKHLGNGGSLLIFANHFSYLEIALHTRIIQDYLTSLDHVTGIASRRHFDKEQGMINRIQSELTSDWKKIYGGDILLAVQRKDREDYEDWARFNGKTASQAARRLREEPGSIVFICPEGTRSTTNKLLKAEEGLDTILKHGGENVLALPLAAIHKTILPGRRTTVTAGELFSYQDLLDDKAMYQAHYERSMGLEDPKKMPDINLSDCAMTRLASYLPIDNQGVYTDLVAVRKQLILPGDVDFKTPSC